MTVAADINPVTIISLKTIKIRRNQPAQTYLQERTGADY